MEKYKVVLEIEEGFLLGGVKRHESSYFDTYQEAEAWLQQAYETNKNAGRMPTGYRIVPKQVAQGRK
jgi:hypothetical protein